MGNINTVSDKTENEINYHYKKFDKNIVISKEIINEDKECTNKYKNKKNVVSDSENEKNQGKFIN